MIGNSIRLQMLIPHKTHEFHDICYDGPIRFLQNFVSPQNETPILFNSVQPRLDKCREALRQKEIFAIIIETGLSRLKSTSS